MKEHAETEYVPRIGLISILSGFGGLIIAVSLYAGEGLIQPSMLTTMLVRLTIFLMGGGFLALLYPVLKENL